MSVSIEATPTAPAIGEHRVRSEGGIHYVNVEWNGRIRCDCGDFQHRKARLNPTINSPAVDMCKHCAAVIKAANQWADAPHDACHGTGKLQDSVDFIKPHNCWGCRGTGISRVLPMVTL